MFSSILIHGGSCLFYAPFLSHFSHDWDVLHIPNHHFPWLVGNRALDKDDKSVDELDNLHRLR